MDYQEPICPFDNSAYTGVPDAEPTGETLPVREVIERLDALYNSGREKEGGELLTRSREKAAALGDWRGELSMLSELMGYYRRDRQEDLALASVRDGMELVRAHHLGSTVSGATVLLNAATTLKAFGRAAESIPIFEHVSRVYTDNLDPTDYRFGGLYNNMGLSYADLDDFAHAERCFKLAMQCIARIPAPQNELAVTLCNLAELYDRRDPLDERAAACMEEAWEKLNDPALAHDGYHAFTISKCAPSFDYFGFFLYAAQLRERVKEIYERT